MNSKLIAALVPVLLAACGSSDPSSGGSGGAGAGGAGAGGAGQCVSSTILAQPANNYTFSSELKLTPLSVKPKSELTFDWSRVTTDFLGRPTNPTTDIDSVLLVVFNLTLQGLEDTLNRDDGSINNKAAGVLQFLTNKAATAKSIYDFGVPGTPQNTYHTDSGVKTAVDEYLDPAVNDPATHVIGIMPSQGTQPGKNLKMVQAVTLDSAASSVAVNIVGSTRSAAAASGHSGGTEGPSASITYDVDLQHLTPVRVPSARNGVSVDWSGMTKNGLGHDWQSRSISRILVGHYTQTLGELEKQFLDLETVAAQLYSADVSADEPISLATLKDAQGLAFPGVDGTGVWILALSCSVYCSNPAPWYLTILQPCN